MTLEEYAQFALQKSEIQLRACLDNLPDNVWQMRAEPGGSTVSEIVPHLIEAYLAGAAHAEGKQWQWGSYQASLKDQALVDELFRQRKQCAAVCLGAGDEGLRSLVDYFVLHDAYHVGQLVLIRAAGEPSWNPDSIYGG